MYSTERNAPWPHSCHWDAWLILLTEVSVKQDKYWQCTPKAGQILTVHPFMGDFQSKSPGVLELRVLLYWSSASGGPAEHLTLITSYSLSLFLFVCTSLWRSEENVGGFLNFSLPSFLRYCRSLNPELTNLAGWLIEHCAPPHHAGVTGACHRANFLPACWGSKLSSSCLYSKLFRDRAIFPHPWFSLWVSRKHTGGSLCKPLLSTQKQAGFLLYEQHLSRVEATVDSCPVKCAANKDF